MANIPTWKTKAASKREEVLNLIPSEWRLPLPLPPPSDLPCARGETIRQYLSPTEIKITETDAMGIVEHTSSGKWRCEDVAKAFCHRAALAHQMINCLHEIFFQAAIENARKLDRYFDQWKKPYGPLHGLPVSLKDSINVQDVNTSMGYIGWLNNPPNVSESEIVKELRALGAILYVKTSVPQGSFSGETTNHIIGRTDNPHNRHLVVGGSSGGEGGLLALGGSPVGFGTDIGGSIRVPAGWNGCYGLRPSTGRLPYEGIASTLPGQCSIPFVVGPLARSVRDLAFMMKAVLGMEPWKFDPLVHEVPWREIQYEMAMARFCGSRERLAFGVLFSDGVVNPQPPVLRALREVVDLVMSLGHIVMEWKPPSHARAVKIWRDISLIDGGKAFHEALALSGEPATPTIFGAKASSPVDASTVMERNVSLNNYRKAYLDYWDSTASITGSGRPVDALITPFHQGPPPAPGKVRYMASVLPVTQVKKKVDKYPSGYSPLNETDSLVYSDYDVDLLDGAPVGVQLVGRRLQEETVLALTAGISHQLGDTRRSKRL
ncbi:Acetamidase [Aspergillus nanangensis]|uniref:amidase n=1 Tax=Aspergillus nanangensis TaxID=2582783 RepID=A0AAD4CHN7_ASPNN|nr:Acetamidase [Aspergillus nanangensis]